MEKDQGVPDSPPEGIFTAPSVESLLKRAAKTLHTLCRKFARDRWWWLREEDLQESTRRWTRQEIKSQRSADTFLASEQAPGLRCSVRVIWHPHRQRRFRPPVYLLAEFLHTPGLTKETWMEFQEDPALDRYRSVRRISKRVVIHVRLGNLAPRNRNKWQRVLRRSGAWRFDPNRRPPLEDRIQELRQKGDGSGANDLQAFVDGLRPEVKAKWENREAPGWRTVWIHPHKQTVDDVHFLLLLILLQEGVIQSTETLQAQALAYLKQCRGVSSDATAHLVLLKLRRHFDEPEDWRALPSYIRRVVKEEARIREGRPRGVNPEHMFEEDRLQEIVGTSSMKDTDLREVYEQEVRGDGGRYQPTRRAQTHSKIPSRHSVSAAVVLLSREGLAVSPDTLYDWINAGKISFRQERGRRWLETEGIEQARQRLKERMVSRAIRERLIQSGNTPEAARKFIQRRLKAGKTMEEIMREHQANR